MKKLTIDNAHAAELLVQHLGFVAPDPMRGVVEAPMFTLGWDWGKLNLGFNPDSFVFILSDWGEWGESMKEVNHNPLALELDVMLDGGCIEPVVRGVVSRKAIPLEHFVPVLVTLLGAIKKNGARRDSH